jgi:hypothetical protein
MPQSPLKNLSELSKAIHESPVSENQSKSVGAREQADMMHSIQCDRAREEVEGLIQDRGERKKYADKSFKLVCFWILGVFLVLILEGFLSQPIPLGGQPTSLKLSFKLPDSVLLAVVGGTTASIISIFIVVANYLFPKR